VVHGFLELQEVLEVLGFPWFQKVLVLLGFQQVLVVQLGQLVQVLLEVPVVPLRFW